MSTCWVTLSGPSADAAEGNATLTYGLTYYWDTAYGPGGTVEIAYSGSATAGTDYQILTTSVTIPANPAFHPDSGSTSFAVQLKADNLVEDPETLKLTISSSSPGIELKPYGFPPYLDPTPYRESTITIADDPPIVSIAASDADAEEVYGGAPANPGLLTITRTGGDLSTPIAVGLAYSGSATRGTDYSALSEVLVGDSATVGISIVDDEQDEGEEEIIASVTDGGSIYLLGSPSTAKVKAKDNDYTVTVTVDKTGTPTPMSKSGPTKVTIKITQNGKGVPDVVWSPDTMTHGSASSSNNRTDSEGVVVFDLQANRLSPTGATDTFRATASIGGKTYEATVNVVVVE